MDHLGPGRKAIQPACDPVVETGTGGNQQIALCDCEIGIGGAMHAEHAHRLGVLLIEGSLTHQGCGYRQAEAFGQLFHGAMGPAADGSTTDVEQGATGLADQGQSRGNGLGVGAGWQLESSWNRRARSHRRVVEFLQTDVLGHVNQHRAGPATGCNQKGFSHDPADVAGIAHHPGVLHDRQGYAEDVGFLEGVGANRGPRHLPGDHHHRHRVHLGSSDAGDQVGGAGPRSSKADANFACGSGVGIGRMGAALLMAHEDVLQPATGFCLVQFVIDGQDRAAGIAKDVAHSMAMQGIHQGIAAVYSLRSKSFRNSVITTSCGGSGLGRRGEGRQRHGCCRPINLAVNGLRQP